MRVIVLPLPQRASLVVIARLQTRLQTPMIRRRQTRMTGLTASVYSSGSGEIFWDRPDTFGLTYEVSRNDTVLTITDGVSFYDNDLERGTDYTFEVVAIDLQGNRSTPASVTLQTNNGGGVQPPSTDVATPTGLTAMVYSASNAEIMWDRPDTFGLTYEITRNGAIVATTDGISYYNNGLIAGEVYTYEVVAIDLGGQRSAAAMIVINTRDPEVASDPNILEPSDLYTSNGYDPIEVLRVDLRTVTQDGPCNADDESGCKLDDVLADIDKTDDHTVDILVHFSSDDFPDDSSINTHLMAAAHVTSWLWM